MTSRSVSATFGIQRLAYNLLGPVLPILYTHNFRPHHLSSYILPPQTQQRYNGLLFTLGLEAYDSVELENTAPRIRTDYKPEDETLIKGQKNKQWRRERRIKRILTALIGYGVMGYMIYLIVVTQRIIPKIWDPYSILQISRV